MAPNPIFISHRSEYGRIARAMKKVIETASHGQIDVFISEDIPRGNEWRPSIEHHLRTAQSLFLLYGAPYEDWSWCFYEAGYFAAVKPAASDRRIFCLIRPNVNPPGPLSHLQMLTSKDQLIRELIGIFERNAIDVDANELRGLVGKLESGLFSEIREFDGYPRVHFVASDAELAHGEIPPAAQFTGDDSVLGDLFTIQAPSVPWCKVQRLANTETGRQNFVYKWLEETAQILLAARENQFVAPQAVLIGRGGRRYRTLLHRARVQGDGDYRCEFLAIEEVGGPLTGLSSKQLSLLTAIRMGYRFRSEIIQKFPADFDAQSSDERERRIQQIPRVIEDLTVESRTRGNISTEDFLAAFDDLESEKMSRLLDYWPILAREMYKSLGLSSDGKTIIRPGLVGSDVERYRTVLKAMRLLNIEFLSRSCARVAQMMKRSEQELTDNAKALEDAVKALTGPDIKTAA
ncbi:toll/interleukin-1 receptor domain-containing protein [Bradyrhizobium sp. WSM1743]|uniref:toll/interleukin-1 receptor domain-containing protein n=1 Tax=Bradyrhizobium sp. WSM1743 TaxID=318996 RepID=UPI00055D8E29|nr:toll/interleukin-1 receptor domain-containing protein [Bradyrhizobium sp. WSM1743]